MQWFVILLRFRRNSFCCIRLFIDFIFYFLVTVGHRLRWRFLSGVFVDNGNRHGETYSTVRRKKEMLMIRHYIITDRRRQTQERDREWRKKSREPDIQNMKKTATRQKRIKTEIERRKIRKVCLSYRCLFPFVLSLVVVASIG